MALKKFSSQIRMGAAEDEGMACGRRTSASTGQWRSAKDDRVSGAPLFPPHKSQPPRCACIRGEFLLGIGLESVWRLGSRMEQAVEAVALLPLHPRSLLPQLCLSITEFS